MAYRENSPAFQEYASDMLANRDFRSMSLAERGLLNTMRLECWVGGCIPADPDLLAKVLGFQAEEVRCALTPAVLAFFNQIEGDLISPDLEAYREEQNARKARIIEGGRAGGKKSQSKKRDQATLEATLEAGVKAPERRGEERRREEGRGVIKGEQLSEEAKEWIKDFDEAPSVTEGRPSRR